MGGTYRRVERFFKRHVARLTLVAGVLTAGAYVLQRVAGGAPFAVAGYLAVTALCGLPILGRALSGLKLKAVGIELLVTIAVVGALLIGEYSEAGIVTFLFQLGGYLEQRTMEKTRNSIRALTELAPATAWRLGPHGAEEVGVDEVARGDRLLVKTGGKVPVDGEILAGEGYLNEASITGEASPAHKRPGDTLFAGTILDSGTVEMVATRVGEDSTFAKIIALVEEAQDAKSPAERFIDRFSRWYTPAVALLALAVWALTGDVPVAITVLVLACPGALVIGAPAANVAGIGRGARAGVLLKGGDSVHTFAKTDTVLFDKTGTLTQGRPGVTGLYAYTRAVEEHLALAAAAERSSDHPLAAAIGQYAARRGVEDKSAGVHSRAAKGLGISARVGAVEVLVGSARWMEENGITLSREQRRDLMEAQESGATTVLMAADGVLRLTFAISDVLKEDGREAIAALKALGIRRTIMLTGDNAVSAKAVAGALGIDAFRAELLPQEKLAQVKELQGEGHNVAFVGDGINDSPALAAAQTGIAMGNGTDVAVETSDVVLIRSDLWALAAALHLAKRTVAVTRQNIVIAVGTVALLLVGLIAGYIHMSSGMFIHEASILLVIVNAMRLLRVAEYKRGR